MTVLSRSVSRGRKLCSVVLLATAISVLPAGPLFGADSFYLDLLHKGSLAYDRGLYDDAAMSLRIACFGFLDEPELLAESLVRLALVQAEQQDDTGFFETFQRLLDLEEKVRGYSRAQLPGTLKADLESELIVRVPANELARSPEFAKLTERAHSSGEIDPDASRQDMVLRARANPGDTEALLRLAELDLGAGRPKQSLKWLKGIDSVGAHAERATCLRGEARLELEDCRQALSELEDCPSFSAAKSPLAVNYLACLVKTERWDAAGEFLGALPASASSDPRTATLTKRVLRAQAIQSRNEAIPESSVAETGPPDDSRVRDTVELEALRSRLEQATTAAELPDLLEQVRDLVENDPSWTEARYLAGEVAFHAAMWADAASLLQTGGEPGQDRPELRFYLAVCLYEVGDQKAAARVLESVLPNVVRSAFVNEYAEKILGEENPGG